MAYIQGEGRSQGTLFPVVLDDLVPADHMCRVVDAFVGQLDMEKLGFERAQPAETGRPGYDPRSLLKLYLYGYLNQIRSSRRLETECRRNVEVMWLLERLYPAVRSRYADQEPTWRRHLLPVRRLPLSTGIGHVPLSRRENVET
jgi:transposase